MPKKKPILDKIATVENDIFKDYLGKTILNPDKILKSESRGKGIELYEDLLRDPQVRSTLQTRKLTVIGGEWEVVPPSDNADDVKIADYVKSVLLGFNYDTARQSLLSGLVFGFMPAEIMWEYSEGDVWVKEIVGKSAKRFTFDLEGNLRLLTLENRIAGEIVPEKKFIVFRNESDSGSYYGNGLGSSLYWSVWFKKNALKFWLTFAEKFGSPTVIGKYPSGTTEDQQNALLDALEAVQQETAIKIPQTMTIELLEATRTGTINTYQTLYEYMNKDISKVILGHSAAAETTPGRLGNETQASEIRWDYLKADADALCECQNNSLIRWIVDYNFFGVKKYPKVWIRTEPEADLRALAERDRILARDIGVPIKRKYFYDVYGLPEPENDEEIIKLPPQFVPSAFQERSSQLLEGNLLPDQKDVEALSDNSLKKVTLNLDPLQKIIDESTSYLDLQKRIKKAYGLIDMKEFRTLLERAMFVANLKGRSLGEKVKGNLKDARV